MPGNFIWSIARGWGAVERSIILIIFIVAKSYASVMYVYVKYHCVLSLKLNISKMPVINDHSEKKENIFANTHLNTILNTVYTDDVTINDRQIGELRWISLERGCSCSYMHLHKLCDYINETLSWGDSLP